MNLDLAGKRILVTGSTRGIGLSIAKSFINSGCSVVFNGRNSLDIRLLLADYSKYPVYGFPCDASSLQSCEQLHKYVIDQLGGLDVLVCNIGSGKSVPPGSESYDEWLRVFHANFFSATNVIETFRHSISLSSGSIICISSICGNEYVPDAPLTYSVAKSALNAYVKGASRYLAKMNVRINAISPGNIIFPGSVWDNKLSQSPDLVTDLLNREVPLIRLGAPEDISNLTLYLSSDRADFITGSIFTVDGGQTRN